MEESPVMSRYHRAVVGTLAASLLCIPLLAGSSASAAKPKPKPKPKAPAKADPKAGKEAFKKEGCTGCHKTKDFAEGGTTGPDLSEAGKEPAAKLAAYIKKPKSGSVMPAYKGPQATVDNIVAYLMTQK